ncbi:VanW family protein [Symbiobacterium terraclitae]|uniref:VanW family protein n=1 Tax=Symbiobacterium terraclitae TaxID=557451 RepID=UPI0035B540B3
MLLALLATCPLRITAWAHGAPDRPPEGLEFLLARFSTPIVSAEPGRVHNIALAAAKIDGRVLQPGEIFSFNDVVGPRDAAHGWAQANEIYQGEYVLGYGGGICQVTSTLYNAALLGGLEIRERYHHDRPLQYIDPGRDATVVWGLLDFRFRNSLAVPVRLAVRLVPGEPAHLEVALLTPRPVEGEPIAIEEEHVRFLPPDLMEVPDPGLPRGRRVVVDEGQPGLEVRIYRVFGAGPGARRELVSHDRYPPRAGKVLVGTGE